MILFKILFNVLVPLYFLGFLVFAAIRLRMILTGTDEYSWDDVVNVLVWPITLTIPEKRDSLFKSNTDKENN